MAIIELGTHASGVQTQKTKERHAGGVRTENHAD